MDGKVSPVLEEVKQQRYIATRGVREITRSGDLLKIIETVSKSEENNLIGSSDVVIWDMGTPEFPMMSVVASTCRGWLTINVKGREYLSEDFGISFTPREMIVLNQFLEVWKLEGGLSISTAIKNIYEQSYVKDFIPGPKQIRLNKEEFKMFVDKLLRVINSKPVKTES